MDVQFQYKLDDVTVLTCRVVLRLSRTEKSYFSLNYGSTYTVLIPFAKRATSRQYYNLFQLYK